MNDVLIVSVSIICGVIAGVVYGQLKKRKAKDADAFTIVFYSDRLEIERAFNEWADKNGVAKVPNSLVAFLEINGLLNTWKTVKWCRERRQKKQAEEGE